MVCVMNDDIQDLLLLWYVQGPWSRPPGLPPPPCAIRSASLYRGKKFGQSLKTTTILTTTSLAFTSMPLVTE